MINMRNVLASRISWLGPSISLGLLTSMVPQFLRGCGSDIVEQILERIALFDRAGWSHLGKVGLSNKLAKLGATRLRLGIEFLWSRLFVEARYGRGYFLGACQQWRSRRHFPQRWGSMPT